MSFQKMKSTKYPPRLWALVGYPGSGKSTFAVRMREPILVVDADHRFVEVMHLAETVYALSENPADNTNADTITAILKQHMPASKVGTIVVDSLTAIITPLVVQAIVDKEQGREKNLMAGFKDKAMAMRQLQDAVTRWGTDVLWIYHLNDARDAQGQELTKATVSATELVRLTRSINMQLEIAEGTPAKPAPAHKTMTRGIRIVWARCGRSGMTIWDESSNWLGMPEKIEAAAYDGLTSEEQERIEMSTPELFPTADLAIAWAMDQRAFDEIPHARHAYEKLKREGKPKTAREMAALWVADVQRRLAERTPASGQEQLI